MKKVIAAIIVGLLVGGGAVFAVSNTLSQGMVKEGEVTYTTDVIASKLTDIAELSTLEYRYKNAASISQEENSVKFGGFTIPFTGKRLVVTYTGIIKMGPDMQQSSVEMNGNNVTVTIPHSRIISHELDENSFEYLVQESGLFNQLTPEDGGKLRQKQKADIEIAVEEQGLLDEADGRAKDQITAFLEALEPDFNVTVEVAQASEETTE